MDGIGTVRTPRARCFCLPWQTRRVPQLYVSAVTGQVVQVTTSHERFWNWLGAIPHWLYFTQLRRNVAVWAQVVIWVSLAGCFLTFIGIYIGVVQFARNPGQALVAISRHALVASRSRLIFGIFLLAWVASGLVSMNPWGFLDSDEEGHAISLLRGEQTSGAQVKAAMHALPVLSRVPDIVAVESAPLLGGLYLAGHHQSRRTLAIRRKRCVRAPRRRSLDAAFSTTEQASTRHACVDYRGRCLPTSVAPDRETQPVYRIVSDDEQQTRYYFDPLTATLIARFDGNARWYRWLHQGLHTMDFTAALRARPKWDIVMLIFLSGATVSSLTGTYLGIRRLTRSRPREKPSS